MTTLEKLNLYWSLIITSIPGYDTIGVVPKGNPESIASLLANWDTQGGAFPEPTEAQLLTALDVVEAQVAADDATDLIEAESEAGFNSIPNWATWTAAAAEDWIEINVTDLASAKVALKKIAIAVMWLADKNFPNRR